jgi:hypothetical protein
MHDSVGAPPAFRPTGILAGIAFLVAPALAAAQAPVDFALTEPSEPKAVCKENSSLPALAALDHGSAPPSASAGGETRPVEPFPTNIYQGPWSRVALGADVSPLGVGIKGATVLNTFMDLRVDGNFFHYDTGRFEIDGVNVDGQLHLSSAAAKVDIYPWLSVWRLSAGLMFYNANHLDAATRIADGNSFTLDGKTFYSASANTATGATPVTGSGVLGLHRHRPAFVLSGGFGKFIPRSERHWSFPAEFGIVFMGAPTIETNLTGWVCTDKAQTQCGSLADPSNPATTRFNDALQSSLTRWRHDVSSFTLYPVFSYSVMYSFNTGR